MGPLALAFLALSATGSWTVETPYPGNPLKEAVLAGSVSLGNRTGKAELQLDCRPDAGAARLNLRVSTAGIPFEFSPFEGPGGFGERHKLLKLAIGSAFAVIHTFSGYYVEAASFVFSFALSRSETDQLTSKAVGGKLVTLTVQPAKGNGQSLSSMFRLPVDSDPARDVARPCMTIPE
jgi:hypothetical protein